MVRHYLLLAYASLTLSSSDLVYHSLAERLSLEFAALRPSLSVDQVNTILLVHLLPETALMLVVQAPSLPTFRVLFLSVYGYRKMTANDRQENPAVFRGVRLQITSEQHTRRTWRTCRYPNDIYTADVFSWRERPNGAEYEISAEGAPSCLVHVVFLLCS
ncbi:hypothetical protein EDD18DRAFT_378454 [Armillaria luteobubalina]|uniref:Secreted protein n=1 Tax=Armillaria luteobubalina TaxID=153913 RepID=A0AA39Q2B1_9AGAR|nr:hypothetical protein EDD18DRAFT_378454 [Armillaria luteobubalina]